MDPFNCIQIVWSTVAVLQESSNCSSLCDCDRGAYQPLTKLQLPTHSLFLQFHGNRCESPCKKSCRSERSKTASILSFHLDFLFISPLCLLINQPGFVSRFPGTYPAPSLSLISSLLFRLHPSVPGSGIIAVLINACMQFLVFSLWKTSASPRHHGTVKAVSE